MGYAGRAGYFTPPCRHVIRFSPREGMGYSSSFRLARVVSITRALPLTSSAAAMPPMGKPSPVAALVTPALPPSLPPEVAARALSRRKETEALPSSETMVMVRSPKASVRRNCARNVTISLPPSGSAVTS